MINKLRLSSVIALAMLSGCATVPSGPSMMSLPGTGKSFDQFRADDFECRQYASGQVGGTTANEAAADSVARSAALGTAVGAAAGAAIDGGRGAGVGAGMGLAVGALAGTGAGAQSASDAQQRYDFGYTQCMYAKGHKVPVYGSYTSAPASTSAYTPPPPPPTK